MQSKPKWLALFLFAMSLIYLIPEVIFNAKLVEVAGSSGLSDETLHITELFGRAISGIGVTLLMIDLLVSGRVAAQKKNGNSSYGGRCAYCLAYYFLWSKMAGGLFYY